jgi:hypothetical protein
VLNSVVMNLKIIIDFHLFVSKFDYEIQETPQCLDQCQPRHALSAKLSEAHI